MKHKRFIIAVSILAVALIATVRGLSNLTALPVGYAINYGNVPAAEVIHKFGRNDGTGAFEAGTMWRGDKVPFGAANSYPFLAAATTLYISSGDAADAGIEIMLELLDANYVRHMVTTNIGAANTGPGETGTEFVELDGTWIRVNNIMNSGTTAKSTSESIYLHTDDVDTAVKDGVPDAPTTQIIGGLVTGSESSEAAIYTIPKGFTGLIQQVCYGLYEANFVGASLFALNQRQAGSNVQFSTDIATIASEAGGTQCLTFPNAIRAEEKSDVYLFYFSLVASQSLTGSFDLLLLPKRVTH